MKNRNLFEDLKVTTEPKKLSTPNFPVTYWNEDGTYKGTEYVMAMPFMGKDGQPGLKDLILLQEELLRYAVFETAAIGSLICDPVGLDLLNKIARILVVVGKPERGIDLKNLLLAGDYVQIGQIFLSEAYDESTIVPQDYKPSAIARIHRMDFTGKLMKLNQELRTREQQKEIDRIIEQIEPVEEIEQPISTPPPAVVVAKSI